MGDDPMRIEPDHRMDIVSEPDVILLRRLDRGEVAKSSTLGAIRWKREQRWGLPQKYRVAR
jgi:hypothetical protein